MKIKALLLFALAFISITVHAQQGFPFDYEIRDFKQQDSVKMPDKNGILFIGSSSIRLWDDLEQRFADKHVIKRGVGGCTLEQLVNHFTPYILFPYQPRKVFIYAGENDIAAGKTGEFTAGEFYKLWTLLDEKLPNAQIYFMAIKPSPSRAKFLQEFNTANTMVKAFLKNKKRGHYIDVASVILNPVTKQPDPSLFKEDMLHLNSKGYDRWQTVLQPLVK